MRSSMQARAGQGRAGHEQFPRFEPQLMRCPALGTLDDGVDGWRDGDGGWCDVGGRGRWYDIPHAGQDTERAGHRQFPGFESQPMRCPLALGTLGDGVEGGTRNGEGGWCDVGVEGEGGVMPRMQGKAGQGQFPRFEPQSMRCPLALGTQADGVEGGRNGKGVGVTNRGGWGGGVGLRSGMQDRAGHEHFSRYEPQPVRCPLAYQPLETLGDGTDEGRDGEGGWCDVDVSVRVVVVLKSCRAGRTRQDRAVTEVRTQPMSRPFRVLCFSGVSHR